MDHGHPQLRAVAVPVAIAMLLSGFLIAINRGSKNLAESQASGRLVATTTRFNRLGVAGRTIFTRHRSEARFATGVEAIERMVEIEISLRMDHRRTSTPRNQRAFPFPYWPDKSQGRPLTPINSSSVASSPANRTFASATLFRWEVEDKRGI